MVLWRFPQLFEYGGQGICKADQASVVAWKKFDPEKNNFISTEEYGVTGTWDNGGCVYHGPLQLCPAENALQDHSSTII